MHLNNLKKYHFKYNTFNILIISSLVSIFFIISFNYPPQGDSPHYERLGLNIKEGNGFSLSESSPFTPTMLREPVYPFFLAGIFSAFGHKYFPVQLIQVFVFITICIFTYLLSKEIFNSDIAKYSLVLTAFCPTLINYPAFLYSENLATCLILLVGFSLTMAVKRQTLFWYCISGVILGLAALCKSMIFPFILFIIPSLILIKGNIKWGKIILLTLLFVFCYLVVISPWILRNYYIFNKPMITLRSGKMLWMRAQKVDYNSEEIVKHIIFSLSETIGDKLYPDALRERTSNIYLLDSLKSDSYELELEKKGFTRVEIDDILFKEALEIIKSHSAKYIALTPLESIKMMSFVYLPYLNQPHILDSIKNSNIFIKLLVLTFKGLMRFSAYIIIVMSLFGMYLKRKEFKSWIFLLLILFYINLIHSLLWADGRYATPLIPYYLIFTAVTIDYFKKCLSNKNLLSH